ncbi:putative p22 protein [Pueraria lobata-associated crinivirus]|nr:putative p22 protein [Pueraria lobata-associated crinivirus]
MEYVDVFLSQNLEGARGTSRWHKLMLTGLIDILNDIKSLEYGSRPMFLGRVNSCLIELAVVKPKHVVDLDLLTTGHFLNKNKREGNVLTMLLFTRQFNTDDLMEDLRTISIYFEAYDDFLLFGRIVPPLLSSYLLNLEERALVVNYADSTFIIGYNAEVDARNSNTPFFRSEIMKLCANEFRSDIFKICNSLIFN